MRNVLRRRWPAVAAIAATVAALGVAGSTPATAAPPSPAGTSYYVKSPQDSQTLRCLDSNAAGNVYTNPCQAPGNSYQDWIETAYHGNTTGFYGINYYSFEDVATGRCLDSNAAGNLYTSPCQAPGNQYQDWFAGFLPPTSMSHAALFDLQTQRCLDSNAHGNAYTLPCNGGNFQNWVIRIYVG